jgi:hypothetical protein
MTPEKLNFTQFAIKYGYVSDYDILDHGSLSPSGHTSKKQREARINRHKDRLESNKKGHEAFQQAITEGRIIDIDGKITQESIQRAAEAAKQSIINSRMAQIESRVQMLETIGKGKRGTLKPSISREIAELDIEAQSLGYVRDGNHYRKGK